MLVVLLLLVGTSIELNLGDSCEQALHRLRNEEGLRIESTESLRRAGQEESVLVYTMTKGKKKTAILGCALEEPASLPPSS